MLDKKIKIISVLAVIALMACTLIPVVNNGTMSSDNVQSMAEEEKEQFKYVSLGDSMTVGYGLTGYYPESGPNQYGFLMDVENTYPHMLTEYLTEELSEEYDVKHVQLGMSSTRSVELRALIDDTFTGRDDLPGDDYTQYLFNYDLSSTYSVAEKEYKELAEDYRGFELLQQIYRMELADADLITYNSHYDFGHALSDNIQSIAYGGSGIDTDFTLYYEKEYVEKAKEIEQYLLNYLINFLKEQGIDVEFVIDVIEKIIRGAVYSVISYCANFDAIMGYILDVNPGAKIIVIDTYNMFENLDIKVADITVSIAGFYQTLLDISNFYAKYCSPYAMYTYHVTLDELPMVMGNEFRSGVNEEITDDAKAGLIYAMGLASSAALPSSVSKYDDELDQTGNLSLLMKYIFSSTTIDASQIIGKNINTLMTELGGKLSTAVGYVSLEGSSVLYNEEDGSCTVSLTGMSDIVFSKSELSLLWLNLFSLSGAGVLCHPSPNGHAYIEECIEEKIVRCGILSEENKVCTNTIDANKTEDIDSAYTELYDALVGLYYEWYETYTNLEGNLDAIYQKLVELDNDWLETFGIFALTEPVKMLHSILEEIIDGWDTIKDTILEYAGEFNEFFKQILKDLDPETIIIIVG